MGNTLDSNKPKNFVTYADYKYIGKLNNKNEHHGIGIILYNSGESFYGSFINGKKEGKGIYIDKNLTRYINTWVDNKVFGKVKVVPYNSNRVYYFYYKNYMIEKCIYFDNNINEEQKLLDIFIKLIKLENIYELIENKLCYEYLNKDELIEKGILLNNLTIKGITKYDEKNNSYILKLVKKKKHIDTNDLSDDENLDNFPQHMFSKGSIVHFARKRKKYILGSRNDQTLSYHINDNNKKNCDDKNNTKNNINNTSIINDVVNIYVCSVHKIKKNQISLILRNSTELCKELNVSNMFMLCDKGYFDVCLVSSDISAQRQINAINIMKSNLDNESDILKILFF